MKNIFKWLLMAAAVLAFASCTDKNNNGDEPDPDPVPDAQSSQVAMIRSYDRTVISSEYLFEYDKQGRVTQVKMRIGNTTTISMTLTYSSDKVIISDIPERGNITLGWDGKKATSASGFYTPSPYVSATFNYSGNNLSKITFKDKDGKFNTTSYTWNNGNNTEIYATKYHDKFTYGSIKNNSSLDLISVITGGNFEQECLFHLLGLLGSKSENLPSSVSSEPGNYTRTYNYTTDKQGRLSKILDKLGDTEIIYN